MKKIPDALTDLFLAYLDGTLDETQRAQVEERIRQDENARSCFESLQSADRLFRSVRPEEPGPHFTDRVMEKVSPAGVVRRVSIKKGLLLLAGVLIVMVMGLFLAFTGFFDQQMTYLDLNDVPLYGQWIKRSVPAVPFSGKLTLNVILFLNLGLLLVILDRILKAYFQKRWEETHRHV